MSNGISVLAANVPTIICAIVGGLLADHGHPWFAAAFLVLAFTMAHSIQRPEPK